MKQPFVIAPLLFAINLAVAAPTPAPIRAEIDALMVKLETGGCQFNRNGSWHSAAEAKAHLLRKLEALEGKTTLRSAEQFVELAAAKSSMTGKPYEVKCGTAQAVQSQPWLLNELSAIRAAGRAVKG